ncbi:MAG: transcriptional regulator, HxlR family [Sphingobacterium sp.]|nr:transcriptional regulator, HxlR family [Sphingobacterium sp.]
MAVLMEIIGGKWKTYVLFLINSGIQRPSELQKAMPEANRRVLDLQLRELEFHGIIQRTIYAQLPLKVEYSLTELGCSLLPIIFEMDRWGKGHLSSFKELMNKKRLS